MNDILVIDGMNQVASACLDGKIYMIDLHLHRVTKALAGHKKSVSMLRFNAENGYLVSAGLDHCVQVWNPHVEQKIGSLTGHRNQLVGMEVVLNTHQIITADDSGLVKVWDLRKFAAVQTIAKEAYVKDRSIARNLSRAMTAMCYVSSKQRIAVAHSTVFFIDQTPSLDNTTVDRVAVANDSGLLDEDDDSDDVDEAKKPVAVFYCPPTQYFVALTSWEMKSWDATSGLLVRTASPVIGSEMTCACLVDDCFSCFVGTENGVVARVMVPNGSVVVQRRIHLSEVTAVLWLADTKQVVSSATNGSIVIAHFDSFNVLFKLNHWRGVQSASSAFLSGSAAHDDYARDGRNRSPPEYSVPLSLRAYFYGNEIERLMRIFGQVDTAHCASIPLSKLPFVLETAFPTTLGRHTRDNEEGGADTIEQTPLHGIGAGASSNEMVTFTSLLEILKESLSTLHDSGVGPSSERALSRVSSLSLHSELRLLVSGSSTDGTLCVWNAKNGAVVAQGTCAASSNRPRKSPPSISQIVFLSPLPCFVCVETGSCCLELWSTVALPPTLPYPFGQFATLTHTLSARFHRKAERNIEVASSTSFFITEPVGPHTDPSECDATAVPTPRETCHDTVVVAVQWYYSDGHDDRCLCVADDQGELTCLVLLNWSFAMADVRCADAPVVTTMRWLVRSPHQVTSLYTTLTRCCRLSQHVPRDHSRAEFPEARALATMRTRQALAMRPPIGRSSPCA